MAGLAPSFRTIAMDYPNHGHLDAIDFQPDFDHYTACAIAVTDALGGTKGSVAGEAVRAGVSICMANARSDRVEKVVLINRPFSPDCGRTAADARNFGAACDQRMPRVFH
jgi:pimeloyl-ACP methyl ester carboxylesterase